MKTFLHVLIFLCSCGLYSQGYKTLKIERKDVDVNNVIFNAGCVFVYDYEIIIDGLKYKLNSNGSIWDDSFGLVKEIDDTLNLEIHLLVPEFLKSDRTNKNQTEVCYLFSSDLNRFSRTGIVENSDNVWIHPPREGFFRALETCPFPYIKLPIEVGAQWSDKMTIGAHWSNELWGVWSNKLVLNYNYTITGREIVTTSFGDIGCFVVESVALSAVGQSALKSFFSEVYGFVRLEYQMSTGLKVNLWLTAFSSNEKLSYPSGVINYTNSLKTSD
ncbi:hypothetical protein [Alkaliflexus imshenetskii]|uniref:hypothetical protein n=1 Tax=Alkaliflexus imshenetskii TaxID=286730 RepID=UPI0004B8E845|nr:hypothetical protein [Alkaliflexus imshenetskii]